MKNATVAFLVALKRTLPVSAPKADSVMPPPNAEPMPPSFDFWARTTRIRKIEMRRSTKVRIQIRMLM